MINRCRIYRIIQLGLAVLLLTVTDASALKSYAEFSLGYEDNAARTNQKEESFFAAYGAGLSHPFFEDEPVFDLSVYADARYQQFFSVDDNFGIKAGGNLMFPFFGGRLIPGIIFEGQLYRDDLVPSDEKDEYMIGGQIDWFASNLLNVSLYQTWTWISYKESLIISESNLPERPNRRNDQPMNMPFMNQLTQNRSVSQDDRLSSTGISGTLFFSSSFSLDLSFDYGSLDSSIKTESYKSLSSGISAQWRPIDPLVLEGFSNWYQYDYEDVPKINGRTDKNRVYGASIRYRFQDVDLFMKTSWYDNDSDLETENYERKTVQGGVVYSF